MGKAPRSNVIQLILLLLSIVVLGVSLFLQYVSGLHPCPLCLMQRFCIVVLLLCCVAGLYFSAVKKIKIVAVVQLAFALLGLFFASRQLWLQSLPIEQAPACIPDLDVLFHYFPFKDVLHALLWGAGDCAEVTWRFLGFSIPAWSALYFFVMLIGSGVNLFFPVIPKTVHREASKHVSK